ncbi:MAG: hypothetical protein ACOCUL_00530 [Bacteroidota bacterium]
MKPLKILFLLIFAFAACQSGNKPEDPFEDVPEDVLYDGVKEFHQDAIDDIVQNISSPVEIAALIKSLNIPFSKKYLATTDNIDQYNSSFMKALCLGIYGADLGYLNMYNKTNSSIEYLTAIKKLAEGIKVGQFFDFQLLKRLATNNENLDSLMYISVHSFNEMDHYLRVNKRGNLSSLIITGVWIEGLYLATQVVKENPQEDLAQAIGEQKTILTQLLLILNVYKNDKQFKGLIKDLKDIKNQFDDIKITIEVGEPETIEKDGMLMIIQNEKSIVHINDEQLNNIIKTTELIRNKIIKP